MQECGAERDRPPSPARIPSPPSKNFSAALRRCRIAAPESPCRYRNRWPPHPPCIDKDRSRIVAAVIKVHLVMEPGHRRHHRLDHAQGGQRRFQRSPGGRRHEGGRCRARRTPDLPSVRRTCRAPCHSRRLVRGREAGDGRGPGPARIGPTAADNVSPRSAQGDEQMGQQAPEMERLCGPRSPPLKVSTTQRPHACPVTSAPWAPTRDHARNTVLEGASSQRAVASPALVTVRAFSLLARSDDGTRFAGLGPTPPRAPRQ